MKKQVTLSSINRAEVLRYLGYKGIGADETINSLIDECEAEVLKAAVPRYVYRVVDVTQVDEGVRLEGTSVTLKGNSIKEHLKGCNKAALIAVAVIKEELPEYNQTFRFGIGYGDLPLSQQGEFLKILNAPKLIGLNIGKTDMMTPTKSVTAVIGLTTGEVSSKKKGCMSCNLKGTCRFREAGGHCNE